MEAPDWFHFVQFQRPVEVFDSRGMLTLTDRATVGMEFGPSGVKVTLITLAGLWFTIVTDREYRVPATNVSSARKT